MMRITSMHIYGFGKWENKKIDFEDKAMITIVGDNEAGKSTIRAFILFMLFGLPPQQRQRYMPKDGRQLGGKLVIKADDGENYLIERFHDKNNGVAVCYDQSGQKLDSAWLGNELNGVDRTLYNKIFNFDVFSLQVSEGYSREQLGEVLLSVGMTGSDRIYQAEKKLKSSSDALYRPRGTKPLLNQTLKQLTEKERQLKKNEDSIEAYEAKQKLKLDLQDEADQITIELEQLNKDYLLFKEQARIHQSIEKYHLLIEKLRDFPETMDFPEQGEETYHHLKSELQPLKVDAQIVKQQLLDLEEDLNQVIDRLLPDNVRGDILLSLDEVKSYQDHVKEENHLKRQLEQKEQTLTTEIAQLKLNMTEDNIVHLPLNYTTEQTWEHLASQNNRLNVEIPDQEQSLLKIEKIKEELEEDLLRLKEKTLTTSEKSVVEKELDQLESLITNEGSGSSDRLYKGHQLTTLIISMMIIVSLFLIIFSENNWLNWFLSIFTLVIGSLLLFNQIRTGRQLSAELNVKSKQLSSELLDRKIELSEKLMKHEEHRDELLIFEQELKQNKIEKMKKEEQLNTLRAEQQRMIAAIEEEKTAFPFLKQISASHWPDLADRLFYILDIIEERNQMKRELGVEREWLKAFEEKVLTRFENILNNDQSTFQHKLNQIQTISIEQRSLLEQKEKLENRIAEQEKLYNKLKAKSVPYQDEIDQLLERTQTKTESEFLALAKKFKEWHSLKVELKDTTNQIKLHLPESLVADILSGSYLSISELELELKEYEAKISSADQKLQELYKKIAEQQAIIQHQEQSTTLVDLKHDFYFTKEKFVEEAKEWIIYQIALKQIEKTKEIFQTSYLPVVLNKTAKMIAQITNNRYASVEFDRDHQQIYLISGDGVPYHLNELSQGTLDQLFIAIRLAISTWLAEHISMPFLIDDSFVHLDESRQKQVRRILAGLKDVHQIIYFSKTKNSFGDHLSTSEQQIILLS